MTHQPFPDEVDLVELQSRFKHITTLLFIALAGVFTLASCNMPTSRDAPEEELIQDDEMTLAEALAVPPEDRRDSVLEEMGAPDTFLIKFEELDGQVVRWEEWSYFDFNARFDFVDGELLWTVELEPVPDDTFYAHFYDPFDFEAYMSEVQVRAVLADQELAALPLEEADVPEGLLLAGDQILLGFDDDRLVYVETFALTFEEPGEGVSMLPAEADESAEGESESTAATNQTPAITAASPTTVPATTSLPGDLLMSDEFNVPGDAAALFGAEAMAFEHVGGKGRLTGYFPGGVLPVMYAEPAIGDFILEIEITTQSLASGSRVGVIFRSDDPENTLTYYYHIVLGPADQVVALDRLKDGAYTLLKAQTVPASLLPQNGTHRLRLEVEGALIRVSLDGTHVFDYNDSELPDPGLVGLSMITTTPPEQVQFDNLKIFPLP